MSTQTVLVTGGLGFIGSHTVVELINKGYKPIIVDDLSNARYEILNRISEIVQDEVAFEKMNLAEGEKVQELFNKYAFDAVIHFAASKAVGESVQLPVKYYHNNLVSLMNLITSCEASDVRKLIFSSSCTVYGEPEKIPVNEESSLKPATSPYGNTKKIGEEILSDYCKVNPDFRAISLRYFNPVGAHKSAKIGEFPSGIPNNLVPFITQTAAGIREKLSVFGNDYATPDGTCIRDYLHVVDLSTAHIDALEYTEGMAVNYDFFNIGTGEGKSVLEVIAAFEKISGNELNYEIVQRRPGDVEKIYADPSKARKILGWRPTYGLDDMLRTAWDWQLSLQTTPLKSNLN